MRTKTVERLIRQMNNRPWHVKLRHRCRVELFLCACRIKQYIKRDDIQGEGDE